LALFRAYKAGFMEHYLNSLRRVEKCISKIAGTNEVKKVFFHFMEPFSRVKPSIEHRKNSFEKYIDNTTHNFFNFATFVGIGIAINECPESMYFGIITTQAGEYQLEHINIGPCGWTGKTGSQSHFRVGGGQQESTLAQSIEILQKQKDGQMNVYGVPHEYGCDLLKQLKNNVKIDVMNDLPIFFPELAAVVKPNFFSFELFKCPRLYPRKDAPLTGPGRCAGLIINPQGALHWYCYCGDIHGFTLDVKFTTMDFGYGKQDPQLPQFKMEKLSKSNYQKMVEHTSNHCGILTEDNYLNYFVQIAKEEEYTAGFEDAN